MSEPARYTAPNSDAETTLLATLGCPSCQGALKAIASSADVLDCLRCGLSFPILSDGDDAMLWLFPDPECARLDWLARLNGFNAQTTTLLESLGRALRQPQLLDGARRRLQMLYDAREQQWQQVNTILADIALAEPVSETQPTPSARLLHRVPGNQAIDSYSLNLFRDWAWNNGEYLEMRSIVFGLLKACKGAGPGSVLTLGAGGCRLSMDLHRHIPSAQSFALDINPLLLTMAGRIVRGDGVACHEFPLIPRDARVAVSKTLAASEPLTADEAASFNLILGDCSNLPVRQRSVGTLITPWLIDIQPQEFSLFAKRMNAAMVDGGVWINTGSLAFLNQLPEHRYTSDELLDILVECGFEIVTSEHRTVNYLCSPDSAHGRVETVFSFAVRKISDCAAVSHIDYVPEWLSNTTKPIPETTTLPVDAARHLLNAQVLGAIDGRTSIDELGDMLAAVHSLPPADAVHAIRRIMLERIETTADEGVL